MKEDPNIEIVVGAGPRSPPTARKFVTDLNVKRNIAMLFLRK